jgi:hypothetical protein
MSSVPDKTGVAMNIVLAARRGVGDVRFNVNGLAQFFGSQDWRWWMLPNSHVTSA